MAREIIDRGRAESEIKAAELFRAGLHPAVVYQATGLERAEIKEISNQIFDKRIKAKTLKSRHDEHLCARNPRAAALLVKIYLRKEQDQLETNAFLESWQELVDICPGTEFKITAGWWLLQKFIDGQLAVVQCQTCESHYVQFNDGAECPFCLE